MATKILLILSFALVSGQDDDNSKAKALIQKLRSESIEERERARQGLTDMGKAAAPALEEAARDADGEVAKVASVLLRRLEFQEILSPRLKRLFPGLDLRLAVGGDRECTVFFF
ncbi:MAG TPA: hypothetical protein VFC90_09830, partial [Planctomycetota bacterium]|nr:hypothetical protein [Planctomycetota bacterium]